MAIVIGSVEVQVLPSVRGLRSRLAADLAEPARRAGEEAGALAGRAFAGAMSPHAADGARIGTTLGRDIAAALAPAIRSTIPDAVRTGGTRARTTATRAGEQVGGAFARTMRTRLEAAFRTLPQITVGADTSEADADLAALRVRMESLASRTVGVDIDAAAARAEVEEIEAELIRLGAAHPDVTVRADTAAARAHLAAVREDIDRISARPGVVRLETDGSFGARLRAQVQAAQAALPEINITADTTPARGELASLRAQLASLAEARIGIDVDAATALARIEAVQARLAALADTDADVDVRVDAAAASAALAAVQAQADALDGKNIRLDTTPSLMGVGALAAALAGLAAVPAVGMLAAQLAGLASVSVAAAAGVGMLAAVALPALGGVTSALAARKAAEDDTTASVNTGAVAAAQAANAVRQHAAEAAAQAERQAEAARNLAGVRRQAADQIEAAHQRVSQAADGVCRAEEALTRAQLDARRVQKELTAARAEAARDLEDLGNQLADSALAERSARLRLAEARRDLDKTQADPKADDLTRQRARLAYDEALQHLAEQSQAHRRLTQDKARADKAGVEGSDRVRRANDAVTDAQRRVADQARAVADARTRVAEAERQVGRARQQAAESIARAERQVAAAHRQTATAQVQVAQAAGGAASAATKYHQALAKLTPAARETYDAVLRLKDGFGQWSRELQPEVMPLFTRGLVGARRALPAFTPLVKSAAAGARELWDATSRDLRTPFWSRFRADLTTSARPAVVGLGTAVGYTTKGIAGAFDAVLPHTESFTASLVAGAKRFSEWGTGLRDSPAVAGFVARLKQDAPAVRELLGSLAAIVGNVSRALAPLSAATLPLVASLAHLVARVPPGALEAIGVGLLAISVGLRASAVATGLLNAALNMSPVGWVITAVAVLTLTVVYCYRHVGWFRDGVTTAWDAIKAGTLAAWAVLQPVFAWIADAVMTRVVPAVLWLWNNALAPLLAWLSVQLPLVWETYVKPAFVWLATFITGTVVPAVLWLWTACFEPAFRGIAAVVTAVWNGALKPVFTALWTFIKAVLWPVVWDFANTVVVPAFRFLGQVIATVWGSVIQPALSALSAFIKNVLAPVVLWLFANVVRPTFQFIGAAIAFAWDTVIKPVFSALAWTLKNALGPALSWLYYDVVRPVWRGIGSVIEWGWTNVIRPAFDGIKTAIGFVAKAFSGAKDAIASSWSQIKDATKSPVNFVIGTVWNSGVLKVWNKLTGWIPGIGDKLKLDKLPLLESGGPLPVRPGVFNRPTAIVGEGNPRWPEFVIPTDPKYRPRALGLLQAAGAQMLARGGVIGSVVGKAAGWGTDALSGLWGKVKGGVDILVHPGKILDKLLKPVLGDLDGMDSAKWSQMLRHVFTAPVTGIKDAVVGFVKGLTGGGGSPRQGGDTGGSGVARWAPQVLTALTLLGQSPAWLDTVLRRMNDESGGNPSIVNLWDSNAQTGTPSVGLMQVIGPTYQAYADQFRDVGPFLYGTSINPLANIYAGLNYALHRYGSLSALDRPGGYDNGGFLPPGLSLVYNGLGTPEPVFTPSQWALIAESKNANPAAPQPASGDRTIHLHAVPGIPTEQQVVSALRFADALYA